MSFLKALILFFSPYVNPFERKVDKFFKHVKSTSNVLQVQEKLLELMQENMVILNVWMEKRYKGYRYLTKKVRREMYANAQKIADDFKAHTNNSSISLSNLLGEIESKGLSIEKAYELKLINLGQIMDYLTPEKRYHYIQTASFGKLLRDPAVDKLEGDCNQIVTLYAYLYALNFPISDLQIKLLPSHVCLHFKGIDIEATNATFQKYTDGEHTLPITEIISTNMLDLSDFREDVQIVSPRAMVKSAQLAYAISSLKEIVEGNLKIAYNNVARSALLSKNFDSAAFFYNQAGDLEMLKSVYQQAAVYYAEAHNFSRALINARRLNDKKFEDQIRYQEGAYYYNNDRVDVALKVFQSLGENEMIKACYGKQYNELLKTVNSDKTLEDLKRHKSTYRKMLLLAQRMDDQRLEASLKNTLSQL